MKNKRIEFNYLDRINLDYSITRAEELASAIIHMVGFGLNISALALLLVFSALDGNPTKVVSFALYGAFGNIYFIFSVLYHSLVAPGAKKVFRVLEVCSKYLVIAGVAIPLCLVALGGHLGWMFFGLFSGFCLMGIILSSVNKESMRLLTMIVNILLILTLISYIIVSFHLLAYGLKIWLGAAFLLLLIGVVMKDMRGIAFHHAISHLSYILATVCLFFGFFFYLI